MCIFLLLAAVYVSRNIAYVTTETYLLFWKNLKNIMHGLVKMYVMRCLYLLDNIFIRFGTKLYRQVVGIPMGTNRAPPVAKVLLFCYERDFMMSLSDDKQTDIIEAVNTTSRYLNDILNINNFYFDNMVGQMYPSEFQLNKASLMPLIQRPSF